MIASFDRFPVRMTLLQARCASQSGDCEADVRALMSVPAIRRQLAKLDAGAVRDELSEYGAWDAEELADHESNLMRITWIAAGNIVEDDHAKRRVK